MVKRPHPIHDEIRFNGGCSVFTYENFDSIAGKINGSARGVAFVFDNIESSLLLNVLSLGDLRRAYKNNSHSSIHDIKKSDFIYFDMNTEISLTDLLILNDCGISLLPLMDQGSLRKVIRIEKLLNNKLRELSLPFRHFDNTTEASRVQMPARVSLAGGGVDYSINMMNRSIRFFSFPIDQYCRVSVRIFDRETQSKVTVRCMGNVKLYSENYSVDCKDTGYELINSIVETLGILQNFELVIDTDWEVGSGLGGSSVVTLAVIKAFLETAKVKISKEDLIGLAYYCERIFCGIAGGWQDYFPTVFGSGIHSIGLGKLEHIPINIHKIFTDFDMTLLRLAPRKSVVDSVHFSKPDRQKTVQSVTDLNRVDATIDALQDCIDANNQTNLLKYVKLDWLRKIEQNKHDQSVINADELIRSLNKKTPQMAGKLLGGGGGGYIFLLTLRLDTDATKNFYMSNSNLSDYGVTEITKVRNV